MASKRRYEIEDLVEALKTEPTIRQALKRVGIYPAGGNYDTAHEVIRQFNIDISHMITHKRITRSGNGGRVDKSEPRSDMEWKEALETSRSISQAVRRLGYSVPHGGHYRRARRVIDQYSLDVSHMTGMGWNKGNPNGMKSPNTRPLEEVLQAGTRYNSNKLKQRLIKVGIKQADCEKCCLAEWNGVPIALELNHINGDRLDNRLENIELLCPNCHAQTPTYRGRNIGNGNWAGVAERYTRES